MNNKHQHLIVAAVLGLALTMSSLTGCKWLKSIGERRNQPKDLVLDLGSRTKMRFVWIEPLKLFVGKYEVSNKIFRRFKPDHNSGMHQQMDLNQDDQPVVNVSWDDARKFCEWLTTTYGNSEGRRYHFRLPTEQEWEIFAACGQQVEYPWGDGPIPRKWNYFGRENPEPSQKLDNKDGFRVSCPVQKSGENAWRLLGVGGNVWEWCEDTDGESKSRVYKGASWSDCHPSFLKLTRRSSNAPDYLYVNLGFRVVADISDASVGEQIKPAGETKAAKDLNP